MNYSIFENSQITFPTNKDADSHDSLSETKNDVTDNLIDQIEQQQPQPQPSASNQIASFQDKGELYKQESQQMKKDIVEVRMGNIALQESQKAIEAELRAFLMSQVESLDVELQKIKSECKDDVTQMNIEFGQLKNEYKTLKYDYFVANNIYEEVKKQDDIKKRVYGK